MKPARNQTKRMNSTFSEDHGLVKVRLFNGEAKSNDRWPNFRSRGAKRRMAHSILLIFLLDEVARGADTTFVIHRGVIRRGHPSITEKAMSRQNTTLPCFSHRVATRVVEDRSSGTLTVNQLSVQTKTNRSTSHRYMLNPGHDSSIRIPVGPGD